MAKIKNPEEANLQTPLEEPVQEEIPDISPQSGDLVKELEDAKDSHLRLAAEYDNFRKRSQKEKEVLYTDLKADTAGRFLPVFDNLERALAQETTDEAYKKGVEMIMAGLLEVFEKLGVCSYGEVGESFDPNIHNAVMHIEDENLGEGIISDVFQKGFSVSGKVARFAMVTVAN